MRAAAAAGPHGSRRAVALLTMRDYLRAAYSTLILRRREAPSRRMPADALAAGLLGLVRLLVDQSRARAETLAVAGAGHDIADAAVGPVHRAILVLRGVAHLRVLGGGLRGVDREALARGALIHQEGRRAGRSG